MSCAFYFFSTVKYCTFVTRLMRIYVTKAAMMTILCCYVTSRKSNWWFEYQVVLLRFPFTRFPSETFGINSLLQQTQLEAKLAEERGSHENAEAEIEEVRRQLVLQTDLVWLFDALYS